MALLIEPSPAHDKPAPGASTAPPPDMDQRVILHGMTWKDFEILLAIRGDHAGARLAYLNGEIELMSPSINHEVVKKTIARLIEAYADERAIDLTGCGSWTVKNAFKERGLEPDECYVLGAANKEVPDLAIEVVWTSGGLNKLEIYRGLGVGEVWIWKRNAGITVYLLRGDHDEEASRSALLPELDLKLIDHLATSPNQSQAVRDLRKALRETAAPAAPAPNKP
jgi:Uma2 family endonuclease